MKHSDNRTVYDVAVTNKRMKSPSHPETTLLKDNTEEDDIVRH